MDHVNGLHHITAIAGDAQQNLDFYADVLGMRLVKKSVNQDDPGTYHLFYADAEGSPGSDLTFFPWPRLAPPRMGHGLALEVALDVPTGSLDYWESRLGRYGAKVAERERRFGQVVLPLEDPHGMRLALVEAAEPRAFAAWEGSPVPADRQVRGLFGARLGERDPEPTVAFLGSALGLQHLGSDDGWDRFGLPDRPGVVDLRAMPDARRGAWGVGAVHHIAWRVEDEDHQLEMRGRAEAAGATPTPVIDRFWFKSVYFKEPGGVLFELATEGPGFAVDEDPAHLGESLVLPPWLEARRAAIESVLPPLSVPVGTRG
jgi:glyoxalase family protein